MKVIIPVENSKSAKYNIAQGFHITEYACIFDSASQTYEWLPTSDISRNPGNLSIELKRQGIECVISRNIRFMALGLFIDSGLEVFKAKGKNLIENIDFFMNNQLEPFVPQAELILSDCNGSCGSCNMSCN